MVNKSIGCNVTSCSYHAGNQNYCTLDKILVNFEDGAHSHTHTKECTDCDSFKSKA